MKDIVFWVAILLSVVLVIFGAYMRYNFNRECNVYVTKETVHVIGNNCNYTINLK